MSEFALYRRLLRQARPYWLHLAVLFGIGLLASPIALLNPVPLKIVVDSVLGSRPLPAWLAAALPAAATRSPAPLLAGPIRLLIALAAPPPVQGAPDQLLPASPGARPRHPGPDQPGP